MENSFIDYINCIQQNKINEITYINSLSEEVLKIIEEPDEKNKNIYSIKIIPFLQKFILFNEKEIKNDKKDNDNNIIIEYNGYSIFNHKVFSDEIDLSQKLKVETIKPYINKILSLNFNNITVNINKLSLSLLITSLIEKILVSIHKEHSNLILPRTLSEILLLISSEKIFPTGIINLCIILIGPPTSINIRNLLWHGFLNDEQFTNTLFCSLILLYQTLLQYDIKKFEYKELGNIHINYLNSYCSIPNDLIINEINKCQYIIPNRKEIIKNCVNNIGQNSDEKNINILRLIVEFEHFLRICFISINDINKKFGMANYSSYYITLDVLIQEYIIFNNDGIMVNRPSTKNEIKITKYKNMKKFDNNKNNNSNNDNINEEKNEIIENDKQKFDKKQNKLIEILGNEIIIKLYDLFLIENGIKLRDHLSHGEYDINSFSELAKKCLLFIWYVILVKINDYFYKTKTDLTPDIIICLSLEPEFHPITATKKNLKEIESLLNETNNYFINFDYSDEIYSEYKSNVQNSFISKELTELNEAINKKMINEKTLKLFGNPILISNIKQCNLILGEIKIGLTFVKEAHELLINHLKEKKIKRRQEDALFKLIKSINEILLIFKSFYFISKTIIYDNNNPIKIKLYKQTLIEASKINVIFKNYSFDGYEKMLKDFILKIKNIIKK